MKQILISGILSALSVILIPSTMARAQKVDIPQKRQDYVLVVEEPKAEHPLRLLDDGKILTLDLEEYLVGVVLSEMPASFELEALKAQAVAARTFTCKQMHSGKHTDADVCSSSACCQAWTSTDALREKFGSDAKRILSKGEQAVRQTKGEVLLYNGALIDATYFSCSGGRTEPAAAVWGSDVPYLQSVVSYGEEDAPRDTSVVEVPLGEFCRKVEAAGAVLGELPGKWIGDIQYTDGGGILQMTIGGKCFTGTQMRELFSLNSTKFSLSINAKSIRFDVRGFGHGVGMSQYGAEHMAQEGYPYHTILQYYYRGTQIKNLSQKDGTGFYQI